MNNNIVNTYANIANDFSNTRRKTWNTVSKFIDMIKETDKNVEIGCGNGKNMLYRNINFKGVDICDEFVKICNERKLDVIKGDILDIPLESDSYDNVLCIAVLHHLKSREDRINGIKELFRICKNNGKIMIYVWAFEQPIESKRQFNTQDEMVPYKKNNGDIHYRYYHLYKKNELENEIHDAITNIKSIESNYEYGNWYVIITK